MSFRRMHSTKVSGFTLTELLISLAILAEIATFTIPKVLTAQQNSKDRAIILEDASVLSGAYSTYTIQTGSTAGTKVSDLLPYINYVKLDNSGVQVDNIQMIPADRVLMSAFACTMVPRFITVPT